MARLNEPTFTRILDNVTELRPVPGSLYITGESVEERSSHTTSWQARCTDVEFARLASDSSFEMTLATAGKEHRIKLRSDTSIDTFLNSRNPSAVYLDITGLPHRVWAPLLRAIRYRSEPAFCVYVEPGDYRFSRSPTEATIFDLSESIEGIEPLPGFVSLSASPRSVPIFIPLLGFEGPRFAFMLEEVQPQREDIFPVIGVPGFRPEYPFYTYAGNRIQLWDTRSWVNVRYAAANCPFSLYHVLDELSRECQERRMLVAPIGTKPHALGAVLYCLDHTATTELLYDHPVRRKRRTMGTSRICIYDLSRLRESNSCD